MEIPAALAADLTTLAQALDDPDPNLNPMLSALARVTAMAVDSYLGMSLSIAAGVDTDFGFTMMADNPRQVEIRTSLQLPLARLSDGSALGALTFYAAQSGAFVDLAADIGWALHLDPGVLLLDTHLVVPATGSDTGVAATSRINQAIGVLIESGTEPSDAYGELDRLGHCAGTSRQETATALLADAQRAPPAPPVGASGAQTCQRGGEVAG